MPIVQNGKKQKMIYKDGFPISKVYKGTILLFRATDVLSVGGIGTDAYGVLMVFRFAYRHFHRGHSAQGVIVVQDRFYDIKYDYTQRLIWR